MTLVLRPVFVRLALLSLPVVILTLFAVCWASRKVDTPVAEKRCLLLYAYWEKNPFYSDTLKFFLEIGVRATDPVDYLFIVQGGVGTEKIPMLRNVRVFVRPNTCSDFGAYGEAIEHLGGLALLSRQYAAVLFLNPSVVGPILPKYWPPSVHWSSIFLQRLKGDVGVVGTSIVCLPPEDAGGYGPRVEGMAWAATFPALKAALRTGVFQCFTSKEEAIVKGEYGLSRAVLAAGFNLDSLLTKYGDVDWRIPANWNCNSNLHPTRNGTYDGFSVHPFEVVFHKPLWAWNGKVFSNVFFHEVKSYMRWAIERGTGQILK